MREEIIEPPGQDLDDEYPARDAINPKAFGLRHLILEEVKRRKIAGLLTKIEVEKLESLARVVSVEFTSAKVGYEILLAGHSVKTLGNDKICLFLRGDSESARASQLADGLLSQAEGDLVLIRNREVVRALVDELLLELPADEVFSSSEEFPKLRASLDSLCCWCCGGTGQALVFSKLSTCEDLSDLGDYCVVSCKDCENAFTHPLPQYKAREIAPDVGEERLSSGQARLMDLFLSTRVRNVLEAAETRATKNVLDIGAGGLAFANRLAERGLSVTALEPNTANKRFARAGVTFIDQLFSQQLFNDGVIAAGTYDIVTSWHSLEHIPEPRQALQLMHKALVPQGLLYICVPNIQSLQARIGRNRWAYLDVPHHLTHFSIPGLKRMLTEAGFSVRKIHYVSAEYEIFGFHQTLLNLVSMSHNYFYNLAKKGKTNESALRYPRWTKLINRFGLLFLPLSGLFSLLAIALRMPACVEISAVKVK